MVVAISKAVEEGAKAVICASTGNTSASAAAYGAAAGLEVVVVLPKGKIALGKLIQAHRRRREGRRRRRQLRRSAAGRSRDGRAARPSGHAGQLGQPLPDRGPEDRRLRGLRRPGRARPTSWPSPSATPATSPPTGPASTRYRAAGRIDARPRMFGFQAAGAAPIVLGHPVEKPETIATAIRIGNPASWQQAIAARDESGGLIETVTDDEILAAYRELATSQGVFCEPASAASLAGVASWPAAGRIDRTPPLCASSPATASRTRRRPSEPPAPPARSSKRRRPRLASMRALGW